MASQKQIDANRRNASRSTGPRTQQGKARSRQNALRHGFASLTVAVSDTVAPKSDRDVVAVAYDRLQDVDLVRTSLIRSIEDALEQSRPEAADISIRRLGAIDRYATRGLSQFRKSIQKIE